MTKSPFEHWRRLEKKSEEVASSAQSGLSGIRSAARIARQIIKLERGPQISLRNLRKLDCFYAKPVSTFADRALNVLLVLIGVPAGARTLEDQIPNLLNLSRGLGSAEKTRPSGRSAVEVGCSGQRVRSAYYAQGHHTASGQPFDPNGMTAAHRMLPFGTRLTVTNPRTGKSVVVVVNDRGPFSRGLQLDLSLGAAKAIGMQGIGSVCIS